MNNNEVNKATQYTSKTYATPNDIYIVIRVFDLNVETRNGRMHFYVDPLETLPGRKAKPWRKGLLRCDLRVVKGGSGTTERFVKDCGFSS
jgi:hypothetical protein